LNPGPILVNEWFVMTAVLTNGEQVAARDVVVTASLTDAADPIISDTTRLVLDFRLPGLDFMKLAKYSDKNEYDN
jgi:hypothetical protein